MRSSIRPLPASPGQESVWDYPRPPRLEPTNARLRVVFAGATVADSQNAYRVLETSHPPAYYLPLNDIRQDLLIATPGQSFCEFKGVAKYWSLAVNRTIAEKVAWSYPDPTESFRAVRDHLAFYASRVDECWVDEERVQAQDGDFYGGWITSQIVGPFKGAPGTFGW